MRRKYLYTSIDIEKVCPAKKFTLSAVISVISENLYPFGSRKIPYQSGDIKVNLNTRYLLCHSQHISGLAVKPKSCLQISDVQVLIPLVVLFLAAVSSITEENNQHRYTFSSLRRVRPRINRGYGHKVTHRGVRTLPFGSFISGSVSSTVFSSRTTHKPNCSILNIMAKNKGQIITPGKARCYHTRQELCQCQKHFLNQTIIKITTQIK